MNQPRQNTKLARRARLGWKRQVFYNYGMNTCVDFQVAGKTIRPVEETAAEDYKSYNDFGLSLLSSIAKSLAEHGVKVGKVGPGKGCAAGFICEVGAVSISCILSIELSEAQSAFRCSIGNWAAPSIWKQIFRLAPTKEQEDEALSYFCQMLNEVLANDSRLEDLRWWTLQDWCEGKHWKDQ